MSQETTAVALRPYRDADWPAILALWVATWSLARPEIDFSARAPWLADLFAHSRDRGARIVEIFKQAQYHPLSTQLQAAILWAMQKGLFDPVAVDKVKETQNKLADFLESRKASTLEIEKELAAAIEEFKSFNIYWRICATSGGGSNPSKTRPRSPRPCRWSLPQRCARPSRPRSTAGITRSS